MTPHRALLEAIHDAAVAAALPAPLVDEAVTQLRAVRPRALRIAIIAVGKAAPTMATAAVTSLARHGATAAGGIVVGSDDGPAPSPGILRVTGDHPLPASRSVHAAARLGVAIRDATEHADAALVLISGGATSLLAAPVDGITIAQLGALYDALLRSGWDIGAMNAVRKRFLRWGAGRMAQALAPLPVHVAILSDVIGNDAATIASGPCAPDPLTAGDVAHRLGELALGDAPFARALREHLRRVMAGELAETPKPGDPVFRTVSPPITRGNDSALAAAADHARSAGWNVTLSRTPLRGEARERGVEIATGLLRASDGNAVCMIHGGETTVSIPAGLSGAGGRCQELALAAARVLDSSHASGSAISLMAAGTDGRDGPTDAAGAIVDRNTWRRSAANGGNPERALAMRDSHRALGAAGALMPARSTGTNVMDIVVGLVGEP